MGTSSEKLVVLGRVSGVHGVRGWIKVFSFTEPRGNIVDHTSWIVGSDGGRRRVELEAGRDQGRNVIAKLRGVDDRDAAAELIGAEIAVEREALPPCEPGEYYWTDLEGLTVKRTSGETLGVVDHLVATGAHDVLVLSGGPETMIPFVAGRVVQEVDLEAGVIVVDWEAGYQDE